MLLYSSSRFISVHVSSMLSDLFLCGGKHHSIQIIKDLLGQMIICTYSYDTYMHNLIRQTGSIEACFEKRVDIPFKNTSLL